MPRKEENDVIMFMINYDNIIFHHLFYHEIDCHDLLALALAMSDNSATNV